jgi:isoleucyl-tRNA synthetase
VPAERADWARTHRDLIAGEILATSFDLVDPPATVADGVEIGDGVRVAIAKQG